MLLTHYKIKYWAKPVRLSVMAGKGSVRVLETLSIVKHVVFSFRALYFWKLGGLLRRVCEEMFDICGPVTCDLYSVEISRSLTQYEGAPILFF